MMQHCRITSALIKSNATHTSYVYVYFGVHDVLDPVGCVSDRCNGDWMRTSLPEMQQTERDFAITLIIHFTSLSLSFKCDDIARLNIAVLLL